MHNLLTLNILDMFTYDFEVIKYATEMLKTVANQAVADIVALREDEEELMKLNLTAINLP